MIMSRLGINILNSIDRFIARSLVSVGIEKNALITLLFHGLVNNSKELNSGLIKPNYVVSTDFLENTIVYFLSNNYTFVRPKDILNGLIKNKKYVLLTFDDGYYNNTLSLPILEKYNVPATFFISSYYIESYKSFWWDVLYRERLKTNTPIDKINEEFIPLERTKIKIIEGFLTESFGCQAMVPLGDIDRPFTVSELNDFGSHKLVTLGNHTNKHAVLSILDQEEIKDEYTTCRNFLENIKGFDPSIFSYPMGYYSHDIAALSKEFGFKLGFTVNERKNTIPIDIKTLEAMLLNRFTPLHCENWNRQLLDYRTDYSLKQSIKKLLAK